MLPVDIVDEPSDSSSGNMTTYREFNVPRDLDFEATLGVTPQPAEDFASRIEIVGEDGVGLDLTLDPTSRAVSVIVAVGGRQVVRIGREGATDVRLSESAPEIVIAFETDDTTGTLEVSLRPTVSVTEVLLLA